MAKFVIQPHNRLQEWVAQEKGYFKDEGLDYEFWEAPGDYMAAPDLSEGAPEDMRQGAYQSYEKGRESDISCACHWTVNMAAAAGHGRIYGDAYSVSPGGIFVPADSPIKKPEDLADVPVTVGYQSGSHYATIQALEPILKPDQIKLHFGGPPPHRIDQLMGGHVPAATVFGVELYLLEQLGYRKVADATFMIAAMISDNANKEDLRKYFNGLKRAQQDIDLRHELYTQYHLKALPERFHDLVDVRSWGPGERVVFLPYSKEIFNETQKWIDHWDIFEDGLEGRGDYQHSVATAAE